jgi:hypothetical protein
VNNCFTCAFHQAYSDGFYIDFCQCKNEEADDKDLHYDYCFTVKDYKDNCPYYKEKER